MSRRRRAALIVAALAAVTGQIVVTYVPGPPQPLIGTITQSLVGLSFLAAGIAAWLRWPASRLGLLFTITGYLWLLPNLGHLPYALPFTIANLAASVYGAALAHLGLAWPTGRLRSRFEVGVVAADYAWNIGQSFASMFFWNAPREIPSGGQCVPMTASPLSGPSLPGDRTVVSATKRADLHNPHRGFPVR